MAEDEESFLKRFIILPILAGFINLYIISKLLPGNLEEEHPFWHIVLSEPATEILLSLSVAIVSPLLRVLFTTRRGLKFIFLALCMGASLGLLLTFIGGHIRGNLTYGILGGILLSSYLSLLDSNYSFLSLRLSDEEMKGLRETVSNPYTGLEGLVGTSDNSGCLSDLGLIANIFAITVYSWAVVYAFANHSITIPSIGAITTILVLSLIYGQVSKAAESKANSLSFDEKWKLIRQRAEYRIKCRDIYCSCIVSEEGGYCSLACQRDRVLGIKCKCKHLKCAGYFE